MLLWKDTSKLILHPGLSILGVGPTETYYGLLITRPEPRKEWSEYLLGIILITHLDLNNYRNIEIWKFKSVCDRNNFILL